MDKNLYLIELVETGRACCASQPFASQSEPQKVFSAIWDIERLVNGDGFEGFFTCADPALIRFAPEALRRIGAERCAKIVESAIELIEPCMPDDHDWGSAIAVVLEDDAGLAQVERFDERFYEYPDDLTELLFDFVCAHPHAFGEVTEELPEPGAPAPEPPWWKKLFGKR